MPGTPDYFNGKTILITGAGSGIGRTTAQVFAREGCNVVAADINMTAAEETVRQVVDLGVKARAIQCDVADRAQVDAAVQDAIAEFGQINFVLNSAGSAFARLPFLEIGVELWEKTFALNVRGTFNGCQAVLPHMLEKGSGVIVNIASVATWVGGAGNSVHYAASKGAVHTMTLGIGREFAKDNIRCLSISPGMIESAFHDTTPKDVQEHYASQIPMQRMGQTSEIAEAVLFACSDAASYMTADTIKISGGIR